MSNFKLKLLILAISVTSGCHQEINVTTKNEAPANSRKPTEQFLIIGNRLELPTYETAKFYGSGPAWFTTNPSRSIYREYKVTNMSSVRKIEHINPQGFPVTNKELEDRINEDLVSEIGKCYRWASWGNKIAGDVEATVEFQPDGTVKKTSFRTSIPKSNKLTSCLNKMLLEFYLSRFTYRKTLATIKFQFTKSGQIPPTKCIPEPIPQRNTYRLPKGVYLKVLKKLPVDVLVLKKNIKVDDFDEDWDVILRQEKYDIEHQKAIRNWKQNGSIGPKPVREIATVGGLGKRIIYCRCSFGGRWAERALLENEGAYSECYRKALMRNGRTMGLLRFQSVFDAGGNMKTKVVKNETNDEELVKCMLKELSKVNTYPQYFSHQKRMNISGFRFNFGLKFTPDISVPIPQKLRLTKEEVVQFINKAMEIKDFLRVYIAYESLIKVSTPGEACVLKMKMFGILLKYISWSDPIGFNKFDEALELIKKLNGAEQRVCLKAFAKHVTRKMSKNWNLGEGTFQEVIYRKIVNSKLIIEDLPKMLDSYGYYLVENRDNSEALRIWKMLLNHLKNDPKIIHMKNNPNKFSKELERFINHEKRALKFIKKLSSETK